MGTGGNISKAEAILPQRLFFGAISFKDSSLVGVGRMLYLQRAVIGNYAKELTAKP
jgi:hypothetical protein